MPTTVTVGSGKDYATLALAVAGLETGGANEHDFSTDGIATISIEDSFADTSAVSILAANFTNAASVSATAYLKIEVDAANRTHKYDTGKYYMNADPGAQSGQIELDLDYTHIKWVQFFMPVAAGSSDENIRILSGGANIIIEKCVFQNDTGTSEQDCVYAGNYDVGPIYVFDCVFRMGNGTRACIHMQNFNGTGTHTWHIEHCTLNTNLSTYGIRSQNNTGTMNANIRNTASLGNSGSDYSDNDADFTTGSYGNISGDTSAETLFGATGNYNSVTLKDTDTAGDSFYVESDTEDAEDYQLLDGVNTTDIAIDAAEAAGTIDSRIDTTVDIAGNSRPATQGDRDIGAFEVASVGGPVTNKTLSDVLSVTDGSPIQ